MNCSETKDLITNHGFIFVLSLQAVAGLSSTIISSIVILKCGNLYFHINCKILIVTMLLLFIVHSFLITTLQTSQVVMYLTYSDPCNVGLPPEICMALRSPATACMISFACIKFAMLVERSAALWKRKDYETYGPTLGASLVSFSIITAMAATAWIFWNANLSQKQNYCSASTARTVDKITTLLFVLTGIDVITLIGIAILHFCNDTAIKRKVFDLKTSYQLHENYSVIRIMLPLAIFQTICYAIFSSSGAIISLFRKSFTTVGYRIMFASSYILPYYTLISPILTWFVIRYSRKLKANKLKLATQHISNRNDVYFKAYSEMW
ncbi:hypothetical protein RB195_016790 [Necator americanus]|uniref:Integral membrane protein, C.elegans Sra family n=1 Tax=Necator americanus TaxID=51031 RepID=A0ABR1C4Q8_NECAM